MKKPASCKELLAQYAATAPQNPQTELLKFEDVGAFDVYNIAAPFVWQGREILPGRVEPRDSELSQVWFFEKRNGAWHPIEGAPKIQNLQDPFVSLHGGEIVLGGVRLELDGAGKIISYGTVFYRGETLEGLREFAKGPRGMKDIRLVRLPNGKIAVATRPQGEKGGRGKVGFALIERLEELTPELLQDAPLFENLFLEEEWGGVNEMHPLSDGRIGALGHIASWDDKIEDFRHYYPMAFIIDPQDFTATSPRIIACRKDFAAGPAKRHGLEDVVFSGGLVRHGDGTATLFAGLSDARAGTLRIADPFGNL